MPDFLAETNEAGVPVWERATHDALKEWVGFEGPGRRAGRKGHPIRVSNVGSSGVMYGYDIPNVSILLLLFVYPCRCTKSQKSND